LEEEEEGEEEGGAEMKRGFRKYIELESQQLIMAVFSAFTCEFIAKQTRIKVQIEKGRASEGQ